MGMAAQAGALRSPDGVRLGQYLPLSVAVTVAVTVVPLFAVAQLGPPGSPLMVVLHVLATGALSVVIARVLSGLWTRHGQPSDRVFGDLLLWGWIRRAIAERRLDAATREIEAPRAVNGGRGALLRRMSALLEARDPYTHGHSRRVARHAERIARQIGLSSGQVGKIRAAALVHDIGKINLPRPILNKAGKLTDAEFALVKRHPGDGAAMVVSLGDPELTSIVRHHHERIDGTGYPDGLAGDDIPLGARVIAVADTFDAITSSRAYRKPRTHKQALEILQQEAGTQLDAVAVDAFVSYYAARRSVGLATVLAAAPQRLLAGLGGAQSGVAAGVAPIAQTACGVGGVALIGACLGGAALPTSSATADRHEAHRQLSSQTSQAGRSGPTSDSPKVGGRARERDPGAGGNQQGWAAPPTHRPAPRSLKTPTTVPPDTGQPGSGGGGGGGGGGGTPPTVPTLPTVPNVPKLPDVPDLPATPSLPVLPEVHNVLDPLTDRAKPPSLDLPQVNLPQ
jgi:putative nucleotidyltransferase with HDIG domain